MSESALDFGSLLSSLTEHPEMLQKAMSLASTLASSGILNNLMNSSANGSSPPVSERYDAPPSSSPDLSSIGNLLSGLMKNEGNCEERSSHTERAHRTESQSNESGQKHEHFDGERLFSGNRSSDQPEQGHSNRSVRHNSSPVCHADRIRLLQSLRPFLPCDKQEKIDFVIKLLGLLDAAERMGLGKLF